MRRIAWSAAAWLVFAGLYLVLAGTFDAVEAASAAVAATLALSLGVAMTTVDERRFTVSVPARAVLRPLASLLPDAIAVGRVLLGPGRRARGAFVRQPFRSGGADGHSRTRRAATVIGGSFAPRTFVVRGEDGDELLLHCLPARTPSTDHTWPA